MKKKNKKILLSIIIGILIIILFLILSGGGLLTLLLVNKRADFDSNKDYANMETDYSAIYFTTADDIKIQAYEVRTENPKAVILILSGIYGPPVRSFLGYSKAFSELGYSSILIEMRAHGDSGGNKIMLGYEESKDVDAAVEYVGNNYEASIPVIVFGTSMGASVAINSAAENNEIDGVISQSAYSSWEMNIADQFERSGVPSFITSAQVPVTRLFLALKYGFRNISNTPVNNIKRLGSKPIFLLHSSDDSQVCFSNFERLTEYAPETKQTYIQNGDYHFIVKDESEFENPEKNTEYFELITTFIDMIIANHGLIISQ